MGWRYWAQRALTGEWLSTQVPLEDVKITEAISKPGQIDATVSSVHRNLLASDGRPLLEEWGTLIFAELDGQIRAGGILVDSTFSGQKWSLDIAGFTAYGAGQAVTDTQTWGGPDTGTSGAGVDPLDVVRGLWEWLQDQPDGDLGVTVAGTKSAYRLGEWKNAKKLRLEGQPAPKATEVEPSIPIDRVWTSADRKPTAAKGRTVYWRHKIYWYDNKQVGSLIDEMARQTPFDYRETYTWASPAKTGVVMRLELGYPRLGRSRPDLRFVQGETIRKIVPVQRSGDDYANAVHAYGAGEGSKQLRSSYTQRDGRLRRCTAVDRPEITKTAALKSLATEELGRRRHLVDITGFTVDGTHPNSPLGSFAPGDDVLVQTVGGWLPTRLWVRITSMTTDTATREVTVSCQRRDRFNYSGGTS